MSKNSKNESSDPVRYVPLEDAKRLKDETDYARLDAMTDEDIAKAVAEDPDAAPLDIDWTKARLVLPPGKENVTLRVDLDVLAWFRGTGKGFHTRMNAVLRAYMEAQRQSSTKTSTGFARSIPGGRVVISHAT